MADLSKKEGALEWQEQSSGLINKTRVTLAAAVLAVGLSTSVQASDLLKQCDFNKNGFVDTAEMYGIKTRAEFRTADPKIREIVKKEQDCKMDYDLAKGKEDLAKKESNAKKLDEDYSKMVQILAMLDPNEAKKVINDEIKRIETQLKTEKNEVVRKLLLNRLSLLKDRLKDLDRKVA